VLRTSGSFSFVHAADLHLDTPFLGVQASAPFVAEALREASLQAFDAIIELAIERRVDFVLFAGDIYDGAERGIRAQLRFLEGLKRLDDAGIYSLVVHGNHDPLESGWSAITDSWPDRTTIFPARVDSSEGAKVVEIIRDEQVIATVQGVSYKERATTENLSTALSRPDGPGVHIGLLHCNVEGSPREYANYSPCTTQDLRNTGLDYLALGHIHDRRILTADATIGKPWIVYPGNTQARTINETGAKGVYVVNVTNGLIESPEFVACDRIRFVQHEIPIDSCETIIDLITLSREVEEQILRESDSRSVIVRATLTGHSTLHRQLLRKGALEEILEDLRARGRTYEPFCWWEQLIDESVTPIDLAEIGRRGDFSSDLVALAGEIKENVQSRDELMEELVQTIPKSFRNDMTQLFADQTWVEELFRLAELRALDEILSDE
jgi:DNA repair exonuclease SbcCD nuclease subunit